MKDETYLNIFLDKIHKEGIQSLKELEKQYLDIFSKNINIEEFEQKHKLELFFHAHKIYRKDER